ncbi:hypothetical protein SAMN05216480_101559 [Pustulibacterium marinum]|uniref:Uncharacterized protein n=1 Tax=Pustulibacterium marinum TaxID=1224947 RepID=A0A1I7F2A0_9FLAO|nr:hypothetical protein [Pustulibacterium marinum]SFU30318.1 hypothetical protein SAMN05216480_101559 [Pustulibacterium marinum]
MVNFDEHFKYRKKNNVETANSRLHLKKLYRTNDFYNYGILTALKRCEMDSKKFCYKVISTDYHDNIIDLLKSNKENFEHVFRIYIATNSYKASETCYDEKYLLINNVSTSQVQIILQREGCDITSETFIEHEYSNALDYKKKLISLFNELFDIYTQGDSSSAVG